MKYRTEFDSIGKIKVPEDKYWGASTQRSNKYFNIGDFLVRPIVIRSIAIIKKAAAIVNAKNRDLDTKLSKYIVKAAEEIIKGKHNPISNPNSLKAFDENICIINLIRILASMIHYSRLNSVLL